MRAQNPLFPSEHILSTIITFSGSTSASWNYFSNSLAAMVQQFRWLSPLTWCYSNTVGHIPKVYPKQAPVISTNFLPRSSSSSFPAPWSCSLQPPTTSPLCPVFSLSFQSFLLLHSAPLLIPRLRQEGVMRWERRGRGILTRAASARTV